MNDFTFKETATVTPEVEERILKGHENDEKNHGVICNYRNFSISIEDSAGQIMGVLQAYTAYSEIYIDDIFVFPKFRSSGVGRKLIQNLLEKYQGKGYNNVNLVTSDFQAREFYQKCGFTEEFRRINKKNPKLSKTFFVKFFDEEIQTKGLEDK